MELRRGKDVYSAAVTISRVFFGEEPRMQSDDEIYDEKHEHCGPPFKYAELRLGWIPGSARYMFCDLLMELTDNPSCLTDNEIQGRIEALQAKCINEGDDWRLWQSVSTGQEWRKYRLGSAFEKWLEAFPWSWDDDAQHSDHADEPKELRVELQDAILSSVISSVMPIFERRRWGTRALGSGLGQRLGLIKVRVMDRVGVMGRVRVRMGVGRG